MDKIRLNKYIADAGIASRRKAEQFILQGKVKVNGKLVSELGTKINPENDKVFCAGKEIKKAGQIITIMLHKPVGYTCTTRKFEGEDNVLDLIKTDERIYPVGRLDKNSSGLLLLTNDGDLALKMTHPRYEKEKEYIVKVDGDLTKEFLDGMQNGVQLNDGKTKPAKVKQLTNRSFNIIIKEGKNRQIRRMCMQFDYTVLDLKRIRIGDYKLGKLPVGKSIKI